MLIRTVNLAVNSVLFQTICSAHIFSVIEVATQRQWKNKRQYQSCTLPQECKCCLMPLSPYLGPYFFSNSLSCFSLYLLLLKLTGALFFNENDICFSFLYPTCFRATEPRSVPPQEIIARSGLYSFHFSDCIMDSVALDYADWLSHSLLSVRLGHCYKEMHKD